MLGVVVADVLELSDELNSLLIGFVSQNADNLLDGFFDVELGAVLSELACFQLGVI